jgi:hypothetical protein
MRIVCSFREGVTLPSASEFADPFITFAASFVKSPFILGKNFLPVLANSDGYVRVLLLKQFAGLSA